VPSKERNRRKRLDHMVFHAVSCVAHLESYCGPEEAGLRAACRAYVDRMIVLMPALRKLEQLREEEETDE
jgi:hypothetical protein